MPSNIEELETKLVDSPKKTFLIKTNFRPQKLFLCFTVSTFITLFFIFLQILKRISYAKKKGKLG